MLNRLPIGKTPDSYAEMTHASPFWIVRYPHRRRLEVAIELILRDAPNVIVDYGTGDGEMIASMVESGLGDRLELVVAYDPYEPMAELAEARLSPLLGERVAVCRSIEEIAAALGGRKADSISVLEVLEHLSLNERRRFYDFCATHLGPDGRVIIDIPVEVGPALLVKQAGRRVLKRRGRGHRAGELLPKVLGRRTVDPERFDPGRESGWITEHKGFDHRVFRDELAESMSISETRVSPLGGPAWLNQEVFFVAQPRR